jgi:hypothetical protein
MPANGGFQRYRLYLDARLGIGGLWVNLGEFGIWGASVPVALAGGVALTRNLVLLGELYDVRVSDPGQSYRSVADLELYGAGPGVKYYLTPKGFFVAGSVLLSRLRFKSSEYVGLDPTEGHTTRWGATSRFSAGQEWPVSPRWSFGITGELLVGAMGRGDDPFVSDRGDVYVPKGMSLFALASFHDSDDVGSPPSPLPHGYQAHDAFYLNASLGVGWLRTESHNNNGGILIVSGRGTPFALSAGYVFARNLVLAWEYCRLHVSNPSVSEDYDTVGIVSLKWDGMGPGARYYVMPLNLFVGGSLWLSRVRIHDGIPYDTRYGLRWESGYGVTGRMSLGKEFWATDNLGLGFSAEVLLGRMPGRDSWGTYATRGLLLMASASYN